MTPTNMFEVRGKLRASVSLAKGRTVVRESWEIDVTLRIKASIAILSSFSILAVAALAQESSPATSKRMVKVHVDPSYPALAQQMHLAGHVKVEVTVAPDGSIKATRPIGGSPLLLRAALDAVKNWKYETSPRESIEIVEFVFSGPVS